MSKGNKSWIRWGVVLLCLGGGCWGAFAWLHETPFRSPPPAAEHATPARSASLSPSDNDAGSLPKARSHDDGGVFEQSPADSGLVPGASTSSVALSAGSPRFQDTENILLVGLDRRPGVTRGGRTDTLLLAIFDPDSQHLGVLSIPRDLYVKIPNYGKNRINAVYALAHRDGRDPLKALAGVVSATLQLPIAHTLGIDLSVFERVVDRLGGVPVAITCPIVDNFLDARTKSGRRLLSLDAGLQILDGVTAAMFVRSRHGRSDFARSRRQQLVLVGIRKRLLTLRGLSQIPSLLSEVSGSLLTDMSRIELLRVANLWMSVDVRHIHGAILGRREVTYYRTPENWSVLLADELAVQERIGTLFEAPTPGTRSSAVPCVPADVALRRTPKKVAGSREGAAAPMH